MNTNKIKIALGVFVPQRRKPNPKYALSEHEKDLKGKTIVFTGGTDGIGYVAVKMLCEMGAELVLLARDKEKAEKTVDELNSLAKAKASYVLCDLSSLDSVKSCANEILGKYEKIDILVNCAGINMLGKLRFTKDGIETTWSVNYFAPVLLTRLLLPVITERIINLTTDILYIDKMDMETIMKTKDFNTKDRYIESKLALNMFTIDLADEVRDRGISVNALLPGYIQSNLLRDLKGPAKVMQSLMNVMASPTIVGADRIVRLVAANRFKKESGLFMSRDTIQPFHPEALNSKKREQMKIVTERVLAKWLSEKSEQTV